MPYDDIRGSWWDDPDEDEDDTGAGAGDTGAGEVGYLDAEIFLNMFDAVGVCNGCGTVGMVNGWELCEFCMDEFD